MRVRYLSRLLVIPPLALVGACGSTSVVFVSGGGVNDGQGGGVIIIGGNIGDGTSGPQQVTTTSDPFAPGTWNVVGEGVGNAIAAPARATEGVNGSVNPSGTKLPLLQSALTVTPNGIATDTSANSQGALLTVIDPAAGKYQLTIPSLGIDYVFIAPSLLQARQNLTLTPSSGAVVSLIVDGFSSSRMGAWAVRDGASGQTKSFAFFTTGIPTPVNSMPTTGTAKYDANTESGTVGVAMVPNGAGFTSAALSGKGSLTANFGVGAIAGTLTNMTATDSDNVTTPWNDVSVAASIVSGTSSFSGTTAPASSPSAPFALKPSATGRVQGEFYGVSADQLGAVWSLSDGTASAIGVFGGSISPP